MKDKAKKPKFDTKHLEDEQTKLSKLVIEKDTMDFDEVQFIGGIDVTTEKREIIGGIVILNQNLEVLEQTFSKKNARFPYLPGFLAYRELPVLIDSYKKLNTKPDVLFVSGHGVSHPRNCGLASHLGIAIDCATIGITKDLIVGEKKGDKVYIGGKVKAVFVDTKKNSKPIVVSVGHKISLKTAVKLTKRFIREPHKYPEPLAIAHKYTNGIRKELSTE